MLYEVITGLKYVYQKGKWNISLAFFKNSDLLDYSENKEISDSRYAYDIAGRNKEANQFNARITYNWGTIWKQQLGVSGRITSYNVCYTKLLRTGWSRQIHTEFHVFRATQDTTRVKQYS